MKENLEPFAQSHSLTYEDRLLSVSLTLHLRALVERILSACVGQVLCRRHLFYRGPTLFLSWVLLRKCAKASLL